MRTVRCTAVVLVGLLVAGLPLAAAQSSTLDNPNESTPTTLYFHIFDTFDRFVVNTQPMNADFFEVGGTSFPTVSGTPVNNEEIGEYDLNTIYGVSTAGPVEYDFTENGRPRFHPEPGIASEVQIDDAVQPVVYLYLDVRDFLSTDGMTGGGPNAMPAFTFRAQMREGDDFGEDATLDDGKLIMDGKTTVHIVDGQSVPLNDAFASAPVVDHPYATPDEDGIVEIQIPLTVQQDYIPKTEAFNIRLDWYQFGDVQEDAFAEGYIRLVADQDHLPRMEFAITNPVFVEFIHPQVAAGLLLIHTGSNSPWGTYDLDVGSIDVSVTGPSTPQRLLPVVTQNVHVHGLHDQSVEATYLWEFRDEGADLGDYTIEFSVSNAAGTATASGSAGFVISDQEAYGIDESGDVVAPSVTDGEDVETPAPGILVLALPLLAAATLFRRRFL